MNIENQMPLEEQRIDLERRLASHRRKIEETLSPPSSSGSTAMARVDHSFPRSKLMRLLLSEHVVVAVSALAAALMKRRGGGLLQAAFAVYKFFRKPPPSSEALLDT